MRRALAVREEVQKRGRSRPKRLLTCARFARCALCSVELAEPSVSPGEADRLDTEAAVRREYQRLMATDQGMDAKEAEAAAVERVAAAHKAAEAAEARRAAG